MASNDKTKAPELSRFQSFLVALNSPFELKEDKLWDEVVNEPTNNPNDLCSKYGIDEQRAKRLIEARDRYYNEKRVYDTVKENLTERSKSLKNPNHGNCNVGTRSVRMMLPSYIIRKRLIDAGFISNDNTLCFDPGFSGTYSEFNINNFELIPDASFWLSNAINSDAPSFGELKNCIGNKRFDSRLIVDVYTDNERHSVPFWVKTATVQTIIGNGKRADCMAVSSDHKIKISDEVWMSARTDKDHKDKDKGIVGIGYENLITRKPINGHSMLWIHEKFDIKLSFYRKKKCKTVKNIIVSLLTKKLEHNNKKNPFVLFDYEQRHRIPDDTNIQQSNHNQHPQQPSLSGPNRAYSPNMTQQMNQEYTQYQGNTSDHNVLEQQQQQQRLPNPSHVQRQMTETSSYYQNQHPQQPMLMSRCNLHQSCLSDPKRAYFQNMTQQMNQQYTSDHYVFEQQQQRLANPKHVQLPSLNYPQTNPQQMHVAYHPNMDQHRLPYTDHQHAETQRMPYPNQRQTTETSSYYPQQHEFHGLPSHSVYTEHQHDMEPNVQSPDTNYLYGSLEDDPNELNGNGLHNQSVHSASLEPLYTMPPCDYQNDYKRKNLDDNDDEILQLLKKRRLV